MSTLNRTNRTLLACSLALAGSLAGCIVTTGGGARCGDGLCNGAETAISCSADCSTGTCMYDYVIGTTAPATFAGTTVGGTNRTTSNCGGSGAEVALLWTAPASGTYTIDTNGSAYDTILYLRDCAGLELGCDDDSGTGLASMLAVSISAGQSVVIFVDGFGGAAGDYILNIN